MHLVEECGKLLNFVDHDKFMGSGFFGKKSRLAQQAPKFCASSRSNHLASGNVVLSKVDFPVARGPKRKSDRRVEASFKTNIIGYIKYLQREI